METSERFKSILLLLKLLPRLLAMGLRPLLPDLLRIKLANNTTAFLISVMGENELISQLLQRMPENFDFKESSKYATTEEEMEDSIRGYPTLVPYRAYFTNNLRNLRVEHGLNP